MMRPYYVGPMPDVASEPIPEMEGVTLGQNKPNPFNPVTRISFSIPVAEQVQVRVYDVAGREVRTLADRHYAAGSHDVIWDGKNNAGHQLASGVYFYQLRAGAFTQVRKMVMLK